jgi:hypothetical protein
MSRAVFGLGMKVVDEEEARENGKNLISEERDRLLQRQLEDE